MVNRVTIGDNFAEIRPSVLNGQTDTGTSILALYQDDVEKLEELLCQYIDQKLSDLSPKPQCSEEFYGYYVIDGCTQNLIDAMPMLNMQIGSYVYPITPK